MEENSKLQAIMELQNKDYTRQEIATELGYKRLDSMTRFLKKHNYILIDGKYVLDNNTSVLDIEVIENKKPNTQANTETNTNFLDNEIVSLLRGNHEILREMIERYKENKKVYDTNIVIDLIDDRQLKQYPKAIRVNEFVWEDWNVFCEENNKFNKKELVSMALKEYIERHK